MTTKAALHQIIDDLPEEALPEAERLLGSLQERCRACGSNGSATEEADRGAEPDALASALAHATHLGEEFSSRNPHRLARRGEEWFREA
ncbi:MAG TPA: hypothetical protein VKV26_04740 [Dehalococcoidia bacterium]|nr:hypothetical protein [Dehalococcoidia bacterium]